MIVLGIDTSCDDTAVALLSQGKILGETISRQLEHRAWGGVVPEIASRAHLRNLLPVMETLLSEGGICLEKIDVIAVTVGPGLVGALLVGLNFARGLSDAFRIPLIGINHLQAHIWAAEIETKALETPFLALIVSGGHTSLALVRGLGQYQILGETLDDAAGEVLDKIGRLLGLPYPCGALIESISTAGDPQAVKLPRGMKDSGDFNFSFSGLKTAAKLFLDRNPSYKESEKSADFLASFQEAVLDVLVEKTLRARESTGVNALVLGGGVAANSRLREKFQKRSGLNLRFPPISRCTDNGAMIAHLGWKLLSAGNWREQDLCALPDLRLDSQV